MEKPNKEFVENLVKQFKKLCSKYLIVIRTDGKNEIPAIDKKAIEAADSFESLGLHIEFFKEDNLLFNIMKHELVPEHEIQTVEEKNALLKR